MRAALEHRSTQRRGGCDARGVQRRFCGRDQRRDEPERCTLHVDPWRWIDAAHGCVERQIADRPEHEGDEPDREQVPKQQPEPRRDSRDCGGFPKDRLQNFGA